MSKENDKVLAPLMKIAGVKKTLAGKLHKANITKPEDLVNASDLKALARKSKIPLKKLRGLQNNAKKTLESKEPTEQAKPKPKNDIKKGAPAKEARKAQTEETSKKAEAVDTKGPKLKTDPKSKVKSPKADSSAKQPPKTKKPTKSKPALVPSPVQTNRAGLDPLILLEHLQLEKNARYFRETIEQLRGTDLYESIEKMGVVYSLIVAPSTDKPQMFDILDGGRRYLIVKDLVAQGKIKDFKGLHCKIRTDLSEQEKWLLSYDLGKTTRRLSIMDDAWFAYRLKVQFNLSDKGLGKLLGIGATQANKLVSLCRLPEPIQMMVHTGQLGIENAFTLSKLALDVSFPRHSGTKAGVNGNWDFQWEKEPATWRDKRLEIQKDLANKLLIGKLNSEDIVGIVNERIVAEKLSRKNILDMQKDAQENIEKVRKAKEEASIALEGDKQACNTLFAELQETYGKVDPSIQFEDLKDLDSISVWTVENAFSNYGVPGNVITMLQSHLESLINFSDLMEEKDEGGQHPDYYFRFGEHDERFCATCGRSVEGDKPTTAREKTINEISEHLKSLRAKNKQVEGHMVAFKAILANLKKHYSQFKAAETELFRFEESQKKAEALAEVSYEPDAEQEAVNN